MKICLKCLAEKKLSDFYAHRGMADGHLNKCISCTISERRQLVERRKNDPEWVEKRKAQGREYSKRVCRPYKKTDQQYKKRYADRFPEKARAKLVSQRVLKDGFEKHHWSYNEPHFKDVIWLTTNEHKKAHRFIVYDQEMKMYRRYDTNILLDTKESHEAFIIESINNCPD